MGTYELNDDFVRQLLRSPDRIPRALATSLEEQLPIPVPVKIASVVRTNAEFVGPAVFVRWALDSHTHSPWIVAGDHEQPYRTDEIGRIVEVLSPGVDI